MKGPYSTISVPQRDLENITRYVFNEGWVSRQIRRKNLIPGGIFAFSLVGLGIGVYDILNEDFDLFRYINPSSPLDGGLELFVGIFAATAVAISSTHVLPILLNKYYGSKLSPEAENYDYGRIAENRIRQELI